MELIEVKSLIWAQKGKLYIIYENVMWIQWPTIPVWWQKKRYCSDMPSVVSAKKKKNTLDRQQIASQWGLQLIFRMHNSDPTPQGVENRNILLWFKCVLTALHGLVSTSFKIYLDILSYLYITFTIFYYNTISLKCTFFSCSS
jgi:hypothetical protein